MDKLIAQILKFGVVGVLAFIVDYGVLMLLNVGFGVNPVLAAGISFTISVIFNYLASMRFVFKHRDDLSRSKEMSIFIVLSVIGLVINELIIWAGTSLLGETPLMVTITKVFATGVVMVWNFVSRKKWLDAGE